MMKPSLIFLPLLLQILLTFLVYIGATRAKNRAVALGQVDESRRALHKDAWPDDVLKFTNNLANQFEAPVLFYALCLVLWALNAVTMLALAMAWVFVATRYLHAVVHTGSNHIPHRKPIFMVGVACLLVMWGCALAALL